MGRYIKFFPDVVAGEAIAENPLVGHQGLEPWTNRL